jgi:hypothetical protein
MKPLLLLFFSLQILNATSQTLRHQILSQDSALRDVKIARCKCNPNLYLAILITEVHWWEQFELINFKNGHIQWKAYIDTLNTGQAILSARQISLKGLPFPLFEIFDHTHRWNGFYYLYRLDGKKLKKIAETRAVDCCFDGDLIIGHHYECSIVYKNDHLTPIYQDLNNDGYVDVILKGTIQIFAEDDKTLLRQYPAQKVLIYNNSKGRFIEDLTQRKGFKQDDD